MGELGEFSEVERPFQKPNKQTNKKTKKIITEFKIT